MTNEFKVRILIVFALFALIACIWGIIDSIIDKYYLSKEYRYTISEKISYSTPSKTGSVKKYIFVLNSETYSGFTSSNLNTDSSYFIMYYPKNPNRNEATLVVANNTDIRNLPMGGYKELPHK